MCIDVNDAAIPRENATNTASVFSAGRSDPREPLPFHVQLRINAAAFSFSGALSAHAARQFAEALLAAAAECERQATTGAAA